MTTMTKTIATFALVMALFGGTVLADDGNMGQGGYTQCGGINPPPTCPPPGAASPADTGSTDGADASSGSDISDITLVVTGVVETIGLIY